MTEPIKPQEQKKEEKPATQEPKKPETPQAQEPKKDAAAAKPEVKAQEPKKAEPTTPGPVQAPPATKKKNKKISQMTLKELDERLGVVKEKMGTFDSRYAKELLKRKAAIASEAKQSP